MKASHVLALVVLWSLFRKDEHPHTPASHAGQQREANRTPLTVDQARLLIEQSFKRLALREPTLNEHAMLLAHSALETGRWQKMLAWNWGFVTTDGSLDYFTVPGNPLKFRWYVAAPAGCDDWIGQLMSNWPEAWAALDSDDATAYVRGLERGRHGSYFGAGEGPGYRRNMISLYAEFKTALTAAV